LFYRENNRVFENLGIFRNGSASLTGRDLAEQLPVTWVSASTLEVLGVAPQLGRGFLEDDENPGSPPTVVLSHQLWSSRFGKDQRILGQTIHVNGSNHTVIGVMPTEFHFPTPDTQLWLPMEIDHANPDRSYWNSTAIARLRSGITIAAAQADMEALAARMYEAFPDPENAAAVFEELHLSALVHPFKEDLVGDVSGALLILLGSVGCVLLIACANVANLFLARAEERQHEVALRTVLGGSRGAIIFMFLAESTILALSGGVIGLALAHTTGPAILALAPQQIPRSENIGLSSSVLLFALAISLLCSLLVGLLPSLRRIPSPATALQSGGYRIAGGRRRVRETLAVAQLTLALVLMAGSGLMVRSFQKLHDVAPGFESRGVLTMRLHLPGASPETSTATVAFYQAVIDLVRTIPAVQAVGAASGLPLAEGGTMLGHSFEDFPLSEDEFIPNYLTQLIVPGYLETLRIPLHAGRYFDRSDLGGPGRAVIISAPLAERLWPNENPIGKRLTPARFEDTGMWYSVVGVVGPVRYESLEQPATEMVYYPLAPLYFSPDTDPIFSGTLSLAVRTNVAPSSLVGSVTAAIRSIEQNVPLTNVRTMEEIVARARGRTAFSTLLLLIAACVALVLGVVGLYGVVSYLVSQSTREIGIRMALGADQVTVCRMFVKQGLAVATVGVVLGLVGTYAISRLLGSMLYEVSATDPLTLAVVSLLLLAVALAASYLPARRAARVDPVAAMGEL
jgi:predicted permease